MERTVKVEDMRQIKTMRRVPLPALFTDSDRRSHAQRLRCHFSFQLALRYGARQPRMLDEALREAEEAEAAEPEELARTPRSGYRRVP